jgi:putative transcriptional regulator
MANKRLRKELHETARGLYDLGAIGVETLREFDASQLRPLKPFRPMDIKRLRLKARASQAVFAAYLNTSVSTVQKWEIGDKTPSGLALKLLNIVERKGLKALV